MKKIIIIDDNKESCDILEKILTKESYNVAVFYDGDSAYSYMMENDYDLIICDLCMPVTDGYEVIRRIRKMLPHNTPILVYSALQDEQSKEKALQVGANSYLEKPTKINILLQEIHKLI